MLRKSGEEFIILEPKDGFLKVGVFTQSGGPMHVRTVGLLSILDQPLDTLTRELQQTLKEGNTQTRKVFLIIPRSSLIIRYLTVPSQRRHEIRGMLSLGLHQYIPYEAHEVCFDFRVAEDRDDGFSKVLLFSVLESYINEQLLLCEGAGLEVADVLCSTEAAWRSVAEGQEGNGEVRLLVDIDAHSTDVVAYAPNQLKFTRAVNLGSRSKVGDESPEHFVEHLAGEVKLSVDTFRKEFPSLIISSILIYGAEAYTDKVTQALQRMLGCKVSPVDPKRLPVVWNQGSSMLTDFKQKGVSYLCLVGGALLAAGGGALSFLPSVRREERVRKHEERWMVYAGGALLGALGCIALFFVVNLLIVGVQLSELRHDVSRIEKEARVAGRAFGKLEVIVDNYDNKAIILDLIYELQTRTPEGVTLTQLLVEEGDTVKIRGLATKNHVVSEYLNQLEESVLFSKVEFVFSQRKQVERKEFFDFQIVSVLTGRSV